MKRFLLYFTLALTLIFAFHQTILHFSLQLYLAKTAEKAGYHLSYKEIKANLSSITLTNPKLLFEKPSPFTEDEASFNPIMEEFFSAERVEIGYRFLPFSRTLSLSINIISPGIHPTSKGVSLASIKEKLQKSPSFIHTEGSVTTHNGKLFLSEEEEDTLNFSLKQSFGKEKDGLFLNLSDKNNPILALHIEDDEGTLVSHGISPHLLKGLFHLLTPEASPWILSGGPLLGGIRFEITPQGFQRKEGELYIENLFLLNEDKEINTSIKRINFGDGNKGPLSSSLSVQFKEDAILDLSLDPNTTAQGEEAATSLEQYNLTLNQIKDDDLKFLYYLAEKAVPELPILKDLKGELSTKLSLHLRENAFSHLSVGNFKAENLFAEIPAQSVKLKAALIKGNFSFELKESMTLEESFQNTISAVLNVENGTLSSTAIQDLAFHSIQTQIVIDKGKVLPSTAEVSLAGMKGKAEWLQNQKGSFLSIELLGLIDDLFPLIPKRVEQSLSQTLMGDFVELKASITKKSKDFIVEGSVLAREKNGFKNPPLNFGFTLQKGLSENLFKDEKLPSFMPLTSKALRKSAQTTLANESGYSGFTLKDGWLKIDHLSAEKYLSPFLFPEREMALKGDVFIEGFFDLSTIKLNYSGEKVFLESPSLGIEVPFIKNGSHIFNFKERTHFGYLPIASGNYFEKNSGLLFTEVNSSVIFKGEEIHFFDLSAFSNGLFLAGNVDLDLSPEGKGAFDLDVHFNEVEGSFNEAKHLLNHFDNLKFLSNIPLEASLNFGKEGGHLFFGVRNKDDLFEAMFDVEVTEGEMSHPKEDLALRGLSLNLLFDTKTNSLKLSDLQGLLLIGEPEHYSEYVVYSEEISFNDFKNNKSTFDISLKSKDENFIRIAGKTSPSNNIDHPEQIEFHFDKKRTHFGKTYPEKLELLLSDWTKVEHFLAKGKVPFKTLLNDIQPFKESGLIFISPKMINDAVSLKDPRGEIALELFFEGEKGTLGFNVFGKDLGTDERSYKNVSLLGVKREEKWMIEELKLDDLTLSSEFLKDEDLIKVDFLGIKYGEALLMGIEGIYRYGDREIQAAVNLFDIDLAKLETFKELTPLFEELSLNPANIKGQLKGTGKIIVSKNNFNDWEVETDLESSLRGVVVDGLSLQDSDKARFKLHTGKGWELQNLKSGLSIEKGVGEALFDLQSLAYEFDSKAFSLKNLEVNIDSFGIDELQKDLKERLSDFDDNFINIAKEFSNGKPLKGVLSFEKMGSEFSSEIKLEDGVYSILKTPYNIKNFTLLINQDEIEVELLYPLHKQPVWISLHTQLKDLTKGTVLLTEDGLLDLEERPALRIGWINDPFKGLNLEYLTGTLSGVTLDLEENKNNRTSPHALQLTGTIGINGHSAKNIAGTALEEVLEALKLGSGYLVKGDLEISKELNQNNSLDVRFFGELFGTDIDIKGYRFKHMNSQVVFEPSTLQLFNLTLSDFSGTLHMNNLIAKKRDPLKEDSFWDLSIPSLSVYDFRPSLLYDISEPPPKKRKPLIVRTLTLEDFKGTVGNKKSFTGHGALVFNNPQKKNLQNTLFAIPAEILTRIGLNLSVLTPVSGTIDYVITNEKIYLTNFKDVYSDGKISKFRLNPDQYSTLDFDGNLDMNIRFKQSTILLKLAEFFNIQVKGSLQKPVYSLQRQKYFTNKEELYTSDLEKEIEKAPL